MFKTGKIYAPMMISSPIPILVILSIMYLSNSIFDKIHEAELRKACSLGSLNSESGEYEDLEITEGDDRGWYMIKFRKKDWIFSREGYCPSFKEER